MRRQEGFILVSAMHTAGVYINDWEVVYQRYDAWVENWFFKIQLIITIRLAKIMECPSQADLLNQQVMVRLLPANLTLVPGNRFFTQSLMDRGASASY
jgi:hypothetical protein